MSAVEINFDGLVGPTHNYAGLAMGNIASQKHQYRVSNPREAALQGLSKMKYLMDLGLPQAVLPPHERPAVGLLRQIGYTGSDISILTRAYQDNFSLLSACFSASAMWTANAATLSPSMDTQDGCVHITPANLISHFHRALEWPTTTRMLKTIFSDTRYFVHHDRLPLMNAFGDEGAANHTRLCRRHGEAGLSLFVFGRYAFDKKQSGPSIFPARQTLEASTAISRLHQLDPGRVVFAQQNPAAIDAGVFHNDVIAVGNQHVFLYHEEAFLETAAVIQTLREKLSQPLVAIPISAKSVSLQAAVQTYLFNSQLVTMPDDTMILIAPREAEENPTVKDCLDRIVQMDNPIRAVHFVDCRQSMMNGGGPACLRWRVVLNEMELQSVQEKTAVVLTPERYTKLQNWVRQYYRDRLSKEDFLDPQWLVEIRTALDELTQLLQLGSLYEFQR